MHVDLQRHARLRGFAIALGASLMRIDYQLNHRGQGAVSWICRAYMFRAITSWWIITPIFAIGFRTVLPMKYFAR